jgi:hypothetical protein
MGMGGDGIPEGLSVQRAPRPYREQVTNKPVTLPSDKTLKGTVTPRWLRRNGDVAACPVVS